MEEWMWDGSYLILTNLYSITLTIFTPRYALTVLAISSLCTTNNQGYTQNHKRASGRQHLTFNCDNNPIKLIIHASCKNDIDFKLLKKQNNIQLTDHSLKIKSRTIYLYQILLRIVCFSCVTL